jgi:hypothetical protein
MRIRALIFVAVGLVMLLIGLEEYHTGFHNSDFGWNMKWVEQEYNTTLHDIGMDNKIRTPSELINLGDNQQWNGLYHSILGALVFGGAVVAMVSDKADIERRVIE